jgi:hypothetical protein
LDQSAKGENPDRRTLKLQDCWGGHKGDTPTQKNDLSRIPKKEVQGPYRAIDPLMMMMMMMIMSLYLQKLY